MATSLVFVYLTFRIKKEPINLQQFQNHRLGRFSDDDSILSLAEFPVTKHSRRHSVSNRNAIECCGNDALMF